VVRIGSAKEEDHSGPAVEVTSPQYYSDPQTEMAGCSRNTAGAAADVGDFVPLTPPDLVSIAEDGYLVTVMAKDRSGVAWVKVYLDWDSTGIVTRDPCDMATPYSVKIPKEKFGADSSIHAIYAIACDVFGNLDTSVTVPFRVNTLAETAIELIHHSSVNPVSVLGAESCKRQSNQEVIAKQTASSLTKAALTSGVDGWIARGRVQPKNNVSPALSGMRFENNGIKYIFGLDASKNKAVLFRANQNGIALLGEASARVKSGAWYDLSIRIADGTITGFVNGREKLMTQAIQ